MSMFQWIHNDTINNAGRYFICRVCNLENIVKNCKKAILGHEILVLSLYFLECGNLHTKFPSEFYCVIIP